MATLILLHSDLSGSDHFGELLRDHGHRLDLRHLHRGDALPADLDGIDAVVSCGGPGDPTAPEAAAEADLLRAAAEADLAVVGLCYGGQLLARALGGTVAKHEQGIELGYHDVDLTPAGRDDPAYAGIAWNSRQLHAHRFHVTELPPDARCLARSAHTPVQAFAWGHRAYGIQYHPEAYAHRLASWVDDDPAMLQEAGVTRDALVAQNEAEFPAMNRLALHLFERLALLVMPLDRRFAGIAKDIHH